MTKQKMLDAHGGFDVAQGVKGAGEDVGAGKGDQARDETHNGETDFGC